MLVTRLPLPDTLNSPPSPPYIPDRKGCLPRCFAGSKQEHFLVQARSRSRRSRAQGRDSPPIPTSWAHCGSAPSVALLAVRRPQLAARSEATQIHSLTQHALIHVWVNSVSVPQRGPSFCRRVKLEANSLLVFRLPSASECRLLGSWQQQGQRTSTAPRSESYRCGPEHAAVVKVIAQIRL